MSRKHTSPEPKRPFNKGYCHGCEYSRVRVWVPHHPLFECTKGGRMDERGTKTIECPTGLDAGPFRHNRDARQEDRTVRDIVLRLCGGVRIE